MSANPSAMPAPGALPMSGAAGGRPVGGQGVGSGLRTRFDGMKNAAIDNAMGKSDGWAKGVGAGNQGVLLDDIPRLLAFLGFKVVNAERICITREELDEYEAYRVIARTHLAPQPKLEQDFDS